METRRLEARKPFLDDQLKRYTEVTRIAAILATVDPESGAFSTAQGRFWEMYWSELALVETKGVEEAMVAMGKCLNKDCSGVIERPTCSTAHWHCHMRVANHFLSPGRE